MLVVDENNYEAGVHEGDLVYDPRPPLDPDEVEDIPLDKSADIVIKVASVGLDRNLARLLRK